MTATRASATSRHRPRFAALLAVLLIAAAVFLQRPRPGRTLVTYRIGGVDARFGVSPGEVAEAVATAAELWRQPVGRALFQEAAEGTIEIRMVYDQRQENLDQLRTLDAGLSTAQGAIGVAKDQYETLKAEYQRNLGPVVQFISARLLISFNEIRNAPS